MLNVILWSTKWMNWHFGDFSEIRFHKPEFLPVITLAPSVVNPDKFSQFRPRFSIFFSINAKISSERVLSVRGSIAKIFCFMVFPPIHLIYMMSWERSKLSVDSSHWRANNLNLEEITLLVTFRIIFSEIFSILFWTVFLQRGIFLIFWIRRLSFSLLAKEKKDFLIKFSPSEYGLPFFTMIYFSSNFLQYG